MMMENIMLDHQVLVGSPFLRKLQSMENQQPSADNIAHYQQQQQAVATNNYIGTPNSSSLSDIHIHDDGLLAIKQEIYHPITSTHDMLPATAQSSAPAPPPPLPQDIAVINYLLANPGFPNILSCKQEQKEEEDKAAAAELVLMSSLPSYSAALLGPRPPLLRTSENHDSYSSYHSYNTPLMHFAPRGGSSSQYISGPSSSYNTSLAEVHVQGGHVQYPSPAGGSGRYSSECSRTYTQLASEDLSLLKEGMQDEANCLNIDGLQSNLTELKRDASCSLSCMTNANNPHIALSTSSSSTPTSGLTTLAKENLQAWMAFDEHYNSSRDFHITDKQSTLTDMNNNMADGDHKNVISSSLMPSHEKKKKRKRKRTSHKNVEEMECQRMTHIAVERNRRKQMNEHLRALRLLMPHSYIQRGDQASIVGGTIRFVEELEQVLQSLRLQKQLRCQHAKFEDNFGPHVGLTHEHMDSHIEDSYASTSSRMANVEVIMLTSSTIFTKVLTEKRPHQLLHTLLALTNLSLKVMQLNVTTIESIISYSFNLEVTTFSPS
eukprot:c14525_g1_i1 orf=431-2074(-)